MEKISTKVWEKKLLIEAKDLMHYDCLHGFLKGGRYGRNQTITDIQEILNSAPTDLKFSIESLVNALELLRV